MKEYIKKWLVNRRNVDSPGDKSIIGNGDVTIVEEVKGDLIASVEKITQCTSQSKDKQLLASALDKMVVCA